MGRTKSREEGYYFMWMYRSPTKNKDDTKKTTDDVCKVIKEMNDQGKPILICGDFNYPEIDWKNEYVNDPSNAIYPFIDSIQDSHLHQHIFQPTRYRVGNEPSLLDLIFTNEEGMIRELHHKPGLGESDHECINFTVDYSRPEDESTAKDNFFKADYITIRI